MNSPLRTLAAALLVGGILSAPASADDLSGRWGVGADAGFASGLGSQAIDDTTGNGPALGVSVERAFTPYWRAGINYENIDLNGLRFQPATVSGLYTFLPDGAWSPIAEFGVGAARTDHFPNSQSGVTSVAFKGSLGVQYFFTPNVTVSGRATLYNAGHTAGSIGRQVNAAGFIAGLTYWFGSAHERAAPEPSRSAAPAPPQPTVTSTPRRVSISLNVEFDTNESVVRPQYDEKLREVSQFINSHPEVQVEIAGYTDNLGSSTLNTNLSQRRAEAVRAYMVGHFGVDPSRLTARGYGPLRPVASNATAQGRAQNRRVVAVIETEEK
jgi:outer membrane protein OmpA-like peptidoglycan-associated protein